MHNVRKEGKQTGTKLFNFFINFTEKDEQVTLRVGFEKLKYNWKNISMRKLTHFDYAKFNLLVTNSNYNFNYD